MTDILRNDYITRINSLRPIATTTTGTLALNTPDLPDTVTNADGGLAYTVTNEARLQQATLALTSSDISLASAGGVSLSSTASATGDTTVGDLPNSDVSSSELRNLMVNRLTLWGRVRKIRFTMAGDTTFGAFYEKYALINSPVPAYTGPFTGDPVFDNIQENDDIILANFDAVITSLGTTLDNYKQTLQHTITFCHSSCHSDCHNSRGRR